MSSTRSALAIAVALSLVAGGASSVVISPAAAASCVSKGGQGTGSTVESAKFQAWEAVLQATDWGMWSGWIAGSAKIGTAPGYKVSNVRYRCTPGGLGTSCVAFAKLCK